MNCIKSDHIFLDRRMWILFRLRLRIRVGITRIRNPGSSKVLPMAIILDGNSKTATREWRKVSIFGKKHPNCDCSRCNQMPWTVKITEIAPYVRNLSEIPSNMVLPASSADTPAEQTSDNLWKKELKTVFYLLYRYSPWDVVQIYSTKH